jgi:hypothetical protein
MARTNATTVDEYLQELPAERREVMAAMREFILRNLPKGYREAMSWGCICYEIPLETFPDTYNGQPLGYVGLAAQKDSYSLYLMGVYGDPTKRVELEKGFAKLGKKMNMGKSCLRFKRTEDLPLGTIAKLIAGTPPKKMLAMYEAARAQSKKKRATKRA